MTGYMLKLACPQDPADCLAEPLMALIEESPWVAYLTFGNLYLADVNDDPDQEDEYETGLSLWATSVGSMFEALWRWSEGIPVRISLPSQEGLTKLVAKLTGKASKGDWTVQSSPHIDPALVESMSSFGWESTLWTVLPEGETAALSSGSITESNLKQLVWGGGIRWWLSHGYKEPLLIGHTPSLSMDVIAEMFQKVTGIPAQITKEPFVPHRVRVHRSLTA